MTIQFDCPTCGKEIRTKDAHAGKRARCPQCSASLRVPDPALEEWLGEDVVEEVVRVPAGDGRSELPPRAVAWMTAAAVAGVAAWIGMIVYWRSESGVTAFAIGAVIGRVGMMAGARGGKSAWLAALLTLASVAGGRIGGSYWWVNHGMEQHPDLAEEVPATRESYEATKRMAKEWTELATPRPDEVVVSFMLEHGATQAATAAEVTAEELEHFREEVGPALESLHHADLTMDQYLEYAVGKAQRIVREEGLLTSAIAPRLGLSDYATTVWGMGTAWFLVFASGRRRRRR